MLATQAAERALKDSGLDATQIDAGIISTCTGYLCPGLTSHVIETLGLRLDVPALDLRGPDSGAALPTWRMTDVLMAPGP